MTHSGERVCFTRDCEVVQIPAGIPTTVSRGTEAVITQALGGSFTLQVAGLGSLVRLPGKEAEAIGLDPSELAEPAAGGQVGQVGQVGNDLERQVWDALRTCYDPEIPVNIVDLGLIYDLRISPHGAGQSDVEIKMTLTAQGCGMGGAIAGDAEQKILAIQGIQNAQVEVVWDPPWNPRMISAEGRKQLGIE